MKTFLRTLLFVGLIFLTVHTIVHMRRNTAESQRQPATSAAPQHRAQGHVLKIEPAGGQMSFTRVCFAVDAFPELPASDRNFYEIHEHAYVAAQGPRCMNLAAAPARLKSGDPLVFQIERGGGLQFVACEVD